MVVVSSDQSIVISGLSLCGFSLFFSFSRLLVVVFVPTHLSVGVYADFVPICIERRTRKKDATNTGKTFCLP